MGFSIATLLHNHDTYLLSIYFSYSERNPTAISQHPQPLTTWVLLRFSMDQFFQKCHSIEL